MLALLCGLAASDLAWAQRVQDDRREAPRQDASQPADREQVRTPSVQLDRPARDAGRALDFPTGATPTDPRYVPKPAVVRAAPRLRLLDATERAATYEMTVEWTGSLASVAAQARDSEALLRQAAGGWKDATLSVPLPTTATPRVEVLAAEFDEVALANVAAGEGMVESVARVKAVGLERRQPTGTLVVGALRYDDEAGVLRRYRRVVVQVTYATPFQAGRRVSEAGIAGPPRALASASARGAVTRSVLADGTWHTLSVSREGLYRIDA
ncbi:MAG: hypothetical protein AAGG50_22300, partial [Bacteroidota bacterium]